MKREAHLAIGTGALGVDDTLGDALAIKVGEQVDEVEVLQEEGSILAGTLPGAGVADGVSAGCGVDGLLAVAVARRGLLLVGAHFDDQGCINW